MTYKLISFNLCPFVQRSVITLKEKNVPFEIEYIDLSDKPQWFLDISPFGKVPVLKVEDTVLFESAVINEYIDETTEGSLHPSDPLEKAYNRAWIEFASNLGMVSYRIMSGKSEEDVQDALEKTRTSFGKIEDQIKGPFFNGADFALVDSAFAPMLQRIRWCEEVDPSLKVFDGYPKVAAYATALLARPSVQESLLPNIKDIFREAIRGNPEKQKEPTWLGTRLAA